MAHDLGFKWSIVMQRLPNGQTDKGTQGAAMAMRGTNQSGMRAWNERLVLTLVRTHKALSKAEISRQTGLSAQTVSVIMRALEQDGLLQRGEPVRGRVGQPSVPMSLASDGAFFLGLKIGRRSCELALLDFHGVVRGRRVRRHMWPTPASVLDFALLASSELIESLAIDLQARVAGLGIATPFRMWDWAADIGAPEEEITAWRDCDIRSDLDHALPFPVLLQNDANAACGAELVFGSAQLPTDFVYFYVGFFIGGGIVLNGALFTGRNGNAGALGSMPVHAPDGTRVQLIDLASISVLERALIDRGESAEPLWSDPLNWALDADVLDTWLETAAEAIAQATVASLSVMDFDAAVIDGWMPPSVRSQLVIRTKAALARLDIAGLEPPALIEGTLGPDARTLGAAALPLTDRYMIDRAAQNGPAD